MIPFWSIVGRECSITLEPRPSYCDRGDWIAKLFPRDELFLDIDSQDGWPRYYFSLDAAKSECVAWLKKRQQQIADADWTLVGDEPPACGQVGCESIAEFSYHWPGRGRLFACESCAGKAVSVSRAMGFSVELARL